MTKLPLRNLLARTLVVLSIFVTGPQVSASGMLCSSILRAAADSFRPKSAHPPILSALIQRSKAREREILDRLARATDLDKKLRDHATTIFRISSGQIAPGPKYEVADLKVATLDSLEEIKEFLAALNFQFEGMQRPNHLSSLKIALFSIVAGALSYATFRWDQNFFEIKTQMGAAMALAFAAAIGGFLTLGNVSAVQDGQNEFAGLKHLSKVLSGAIQLSSRDLIYGTEIGSAQRVSFLVTSRPNGKIGMDIFLTEVRKKESDSGGSSGGDDDGGGDGGDGE